MKLSMLAITIIIFLTACSGTSPAATLTPIATASPTATAIPTLAPTPTETPNPFPTDVQTWMAANPDFQWQEEIQGTGLTLSPDQLNRRLKIGQGDVLQIYSTDGTKIDFAWNAEQNVWIKSSDILSKDLNNPKRVQTRDQLNALVSKQESVLTPFSKDTYFPPLDKIYTDYQTQSGSDNTSDFNFWHPFGTLTEAELSRSPFRYVNFIILEKGEGRQYDTYIITEQVYNPADGTFSLLHFGIDDWESGYGLLGFQQYADPIRILLPMYEGFNNMLPGQGFCYGACNQIAFFYENGYFTRDGKLPEIKQLTEAWFAQGKVSEKLESWVNLPWTAWMTNYK